MRFLPSIISAIDDDRFLRCFNDKNKVYVNGDFENPTCLTIAENFDQAILNHSSRVHILSRIATIISELDFNYDINNFEIKQILKTDNVGIKLLEYLNHHCHENITLKILEEKFYLSSTTLNRICKNASGKTVMEFVRAKRLNLAEMLIKNSNYPLNKIAEICGFNDYSTFYKAYKNRYNKSPNDE